MSYIKLPRQITQVFNSLIVFIILFTNSCSNGNTTPLGSDCQRFTKGIFKYEGSTDIRIERSETHQIEYNINGDGGYLYTDKYAITWISDCEYYLTLDSTDHPQDLDFGKNDTMWCKITQINRKGYNFIAIKDTSTYQGQLILTAI